MELEHDLNKEDRFDTKSKARTSARNVNKLVKNISSLHGDLLKLRVEYLLKAKDVFTDEQKAMLIGHLLDFDMDIKDIKLELDMDYMLLDLQDEILAVERNPEKINTIIMTIVDLGTKLIDNQVNHFLKSKDVLTVEQKKELLHIMLMM